MWAPDARSSYLKFCFLFVLISALNFSQALASSTAGAGSDPNQRERILPKLLTDSIMYGVGAGTLVGIASISNFHKNIGANKDPQNVFRGASWGLYGGIILGLYLTYFKSDDATPKEEFPVEPLAETSTKDLQFVWQAHF
jgi:hypothetical protein